jgi:hypothetical protein
MDQATLDMAADWVALHYPELDGAEYDAALQEAAEDILAAEAEQNNRTKRHARQWEQR